MPQTPTVILTGGRTYRFLCEKLPSAPLRGGALSEGH